jgi:hypothetical protein
MTDTDEIITAADVPGVRNDTRLRVYWTHGEGAAKIRWGMPGDFNRCVRELRKYAKGGAAFDPKGLCAEYHHEAIGVWPGREHGHMATMPVAALDTVWDPQAVLVRLSTWAGGDLSRYAQAFVARRTDTDGVDGFAYPVADVIDGRLVMVPQAVFTAAANINADRDLCPADRVWLQAMLSGIHYHVAMNLGDLSVVAPWDTPDDPLVAAVRTGWTVPLAPRDRPWDAGEATARVKAWAGGDMRKYARAFLVKTGDGTKQGDYKFPIADVIDGELRVVPRGVFAAAGVLSGQHGNKPDIGSGDTQRLRAVVLRLYERMASEFKDDSIKAPWLGRGPSAAADGVTVAADWYLNPDQQTPAPGATPMFVVPDNPMPAPDGQPQYTTPDDMNVPISDDGVGDVAPVSGPGAGLGMPGGMTTEPTEHFHALMIVEGLSTGKRTFYDLTWRDPPFAFRWQDEEPVGGGHAGAVRTGNVTRVQKIGDEIHGWGVLDLDQDNGLEYGRRLCAGFAPEVSIGLDEGKVVTEVVYPQGADMMTPGVQPDEVIFRGGRIMELTALNTQAQAEAKCVALPALYQALAERGVCVASAAELGTPIPATGDDEGGVLGPDETLIAAAHTVVIPDAPPEHWFAEPTDVPQHGSLTITDEGRVYGWLAPAGVRHRAFPDRPVMAPMGNVDYHQRFLSKETIVAGGGRVVAGPITMNCGHASPFSTDYEARAEHYDNSCAVFARVNIGERPGAGVWVAGALMPGVTPDQIVRAMMCQLSGDWQPHPDRRGWKEFVAALLVPVPGFPMGRSQASVTVDKDGSLIASAVPVRWAPTTVPGPDLSAVWARLERQMDWDAEARFAAAAARFG